MIYKIIGTLILTILGGFLYRCGGAGKSGKWYDFLLNTKMRDFGLPTISVLLFLFLSWPDFNITHFSLILTWGLLFAAQTTYWKKKGTDARWYNWAMTGLAYSIAWILTVIAQNIPGHIPNSFHVTWLGFLSRSIVCTALTVIVSELFGKVVYEENARGEVEIVTIPLLFIG